MTLAELWTDLEKRMPEERVGRMVQRIHPDSDVDLFVTLEVNGPAGTTRRTLELQVVEEALYGLDLTTGTRHVELAIEERQRGRNALILRLEDPGARDLFATMCTDIAGATAAHRTDVEAVSAWTGRFAKWRRMLQGGPQGLPPRRQRGLYAELLTISTDIVPHVGFDEAILAWKGPDGAPRDFELAGYGVEVKSSAANEPQVVPVNGERQLDDTGLDALVLVHHSLEVLRDTGETLPDRVSAVRALGEGRAEAGTLEDRLLQSGYADLHAPMYRRNGYTVRQSGHFHVRAGFPRIIEDDLTDGVGGVRYSLAIDACRDYEVDQAFLAGALGGKDA